MPPELLTISHRVARITLNHPPANVLTLAVLQDLEECFRTVDGDPQVRVTIVTGAGRFFCAGADVHELVDLRTAHLGLTFAQRGQGLLNRIEGCRKPVLAAINGTCVGGGLEVALACHIRLAASGIQLGLPEIKLGLIPGFGGTQRLPRVVGTSKAAELILTGDSIVAEEALRIGLVNQVVPGPQLLPQAEALAAVIASRGEAAVQAALQAIGESLEAPLSQGLVREAELFGALCASEDKQEATQAFLEKRPARLAGTEA